MYKNFLKIKMFVLISFFVIIISTINILGGYLFLPGNLESEKIVIVQPNLSVSEISQKLKDENIIKYSKLFELLARVYSYYKPLKSGEYKFTKNTTPYQVIRTLAKGKSIIHRLFIPEGYTVQQIIDTIRAETRLNGKINSNIPEGYLMPSTYFYTYQDQREQIIDDMRKKMSLALDKVMPKLSPDSPVKTRLEVLTLASIIEKEAGNNAEKPIVASVFLNRLRKNMKLQADPTTSYAITEGKRPLGRSLTRKDLKTPSPYNTYYAKGLPPGPISCPGKASLRAVVAPAKTDYLYFVVNGKGGHNFSRTLKEHNAYVRAYRNR